MVDSIQGISSPHHPSPPICILTKIILQRCLSDISFKEDPIVLVLGISEYEGKGSTLVISNVLLVFSLTPSFSSWDSLPSIQ